jgi:Tfp pilus assembly protein PilO
MALLPTNARDQRFLFLGVIGVVIAVAYWQLLWNDKNDDLTRLAVCADSLDSANVNVATEAAKSTGPKLVAEAKEYTRELDLLRKLVPLQSEVGPLIDQVSNAARAAGLELSDVKPDGVLAGDHFDTYKFHLAVTGPYHQIAAFLTNIGSLQRIVVPINLKLGRSVKRIGEKRAAADEVLLDADFGIETYVSHPPPPPPTLPPASATQVSGCESLAGKLGVQGLPKAPAPAGKT